MTTTPIEANPKTPAKSDETRRLILEAAEASLREYGYAALSTRQIAASGGIPLSQIHYHFGSKQGLLTSLFEFQNERLLERQQRMFSDATTSLATKWDLACPYLDEDLESGYVRVLMELLAAGWSDPKIASIVRDGLGGWTRLIADLARVAEEQLGGLGGFEADEVAALVSGGFLGAEAQLLVGLENTEIPIRRALRRIGDAIRTFETRQG